MPRLKTLMTHIPLVNLKIRYETTKILEKLTFMNDLNNINLFQLMDDMLKEFYGITEEEYVIILDKATDEEIDILADGCLTENEEAKNKGFEVVNTYIKK